ncbi:FAST kinase domain-containing protein 3, mitochondrial isoform X1 [Salmo salar]|uniref:FAST kinase domain-containing protein 3, mitochondrial-like isoform X1 n=1 Tax=Salmo salar TaxID=8030 RepID=A0ABM3CT88_SALSA|nr:FAST kinase domain-containing protein 3, mitochondrial-like isoform X1 [Salmo salar]XP_013994663.2 FAST kinase domain-containing protein 3, mitochondrial-like isoform X1 [Salmo salar]XP_045549768.1 FAST kinase domain-containing protein 3, mitochondrial-like isoform X1 [Salmo salar]XP_045549769.1 FAST kinase domain-containing protein 3, mitochondrial-like isoform X1 [Salmo salar]
MLWLHSGLGLLSCGSIIIPSPLCPRHAHRPSVLALAGMHAARLYSSGGRGGGGGKPGRRPGLGGRGLPMLENHHPHHVHTPTPSYPPLYQGRPDPHRGPHFHSHHHQQHYHPHLAPPPLPPPMPLYAQLHHHATVGAAGNKKKTWNFIHEKMSYDTFFTMKRLIERSHRGDEVLRWVTQNPGKISHNHYPIALQKIGQLLHAGAAGGGGGDSEAALVPRAGGGVENEGRQILEHQDFQTLCNAIVSDCVKFDNFSIVNCLYAVAALGLPSDSQVVQVLEAESQSRLDQFNQKDVSMVFSSSMKLHPSSQHPLTEACLAGLEKNLERERHPQTLFLLLSYYRLKWHSLQPTDTTTAGNVANVRPNPEQLLANRKILRLVKHTLASVSGVRDQEMALLDEMLAVCAREANNKSLELIFSSHLFYQNRQERFVYSLAEELPEKVDSITPFTMALIAKYIARHRLRETRLLDTIADFLVKKGEYLDSKVIQKLVFPFSRMNYLPSNKVQFFSKLEVMLELKALSSPLATVNILMSLFQLGHFPGLVLHRVFSTAFISNVTNSPYALIVLRYLSLLDAAVELEYQDYTGPRLQDTHKVLMFDHALTADEVNRKYSYKGLVAEALRQLVGEHGYKQDEVLAPGYYTGQPRGTADIQPDVDSTVRYHTVEHNDFLLWIDGSGRVLPIRTGAGTSLSMAPKTPEGSTAVTVLTSDFQNFSPFAPLEVGGDQQPVEGDDAVNFLPYHMQRGANPSSAQRAGPNGGGPLDYNPYYTSADYYSSLAKEHSLESQDSSTLSSPPSDSLAHPGASGVGGSATAAPNSLFQFSIGKILEDEGGAHVGPASQGLNCELPAFYEANGDVKPTSPLQLHPADRAGDQRQLKRVVMSVNDKWHYCHNSEVLVGSRAMRDRHLLLLGYVILQLPYHELEKLNGIEEVKQYLHKKLLEVPL